VGAHHGPARHPWVDFPAAGENGVLGFQVQACRARLCGPRRRSIFAIEPRRASARHGRWGGASSRRRPRTGSAKRKESKVLAQYGGFTRYQEFADVPTMAGSWPKSGRRSAGDDHAVRGAHGILAGRIFPAARCAGERGVAGAAGRAFDATCGTNRPSFAGEAAKLQFDVDPLKRRGRCRGRWLSQLAAKPRATVVQARLAGMGPGGRPSAVILVPAARKRGDAWRGRNRSESSFAAGALSKKILGRG